MRRSFGMIAAVGCVWSLAACDGDDTSVPTGPLCDADSLTAALAAAHPGDTVHLGACRVSGTCTVPGGVTLAGESTLASAIVAPTDRPGLRLTPGTSPTIATNLAVENDGNVAVISRGTGTGEIRLEHVEVRVLRGIALGVERVATLSLTDVSLVGQLTAATAPSYPAAAMIVPTMYSTHGAVVVHVAAVRAMNLDVTGFATAGVMAVDSPGTWTGVNVEAGLGEGLMVSGGAHSFDGLDIHGMFGGIGLLSSIGAAFVEGADVETMGTTVMANAGLGIVHVASPGRHHGLVAMGNGDAAVWIQQTHGFTLDGAGTRLEDNKHAGLLAIDSDGITVRDARVATTIAELTRIHGSPAMTELFGDGIHLMRSSRGAVVQNVQLVDNGRVGLVIDLSRPDGTAGAFDAMTLESVTVQASDPMAFGALCQLGSWPMGWDSGITRVGALGSNDMGFLATRTEMPMQGALEATPTAGAIGSSGLAGIMGPID